MDKENFLIGFQEQFEDTDPGEITFETQYKNLEEWNSMMALVVIAYVDESYSKSLSGDDLKNSNTVEDLYNLITK